MLCKISFTLVLVLGEWKRRHCGSGELKTSKSDFSYWEKGVESTNKEIPSYVNKHEMLGKIVVETCPANIWQGNQK